MRDYGTSSISSRNPRHMPVGKWSRSESGPANSDPEFFLDPWRIFCYCCKHEQKRKDGKEKLMTYEEYTYGIWCTKHRKRYDKNAQKRTVNFYSGIGKRKIIFADGFGILSKGKFIELKLNKS